MTNPGPRMAVWVTAVILAAAGASWAVAADTPPRTLEASLIRVERNGKTAEVAAIRCDGRRLVPLGRALFEAVGEPFILTVAWPWATMTRGERSVRMAVGVCTAAGPDGRMVWLPEPLHAVDGRAALSPEAIAAALEGVGVRCRWDPATQVLEIAAAPARVAPPPGEARPVAGDYGTGATALPEGPAPVQSRWPLHIVLDAGHGGRDCGAVSHSGMCEKEVTLDLVLRIAGILRTQGAKVTLTRDRDRYVSLPARVKIADRAKADLFVSVHVNSSPNKSARGVETYVYGARTSNKRAAAVARRENAEANYMDIILGDLTQQVHHDASIRVAGSVETALVRRLSLIGRAHERVMEAPFYVLARSGRPAVLLEVGFMSNRAEELRLRDKGYRRQLAETIAAGIRGLAGGRS